MMTMLMAASLAAGGCEESSSESTFAPMSVPEDKAVEDLDEDDQKAIIAELEPDRRGLYAGAVGYLDFSGNLDTCIALRTMIVREGRVSVQAGAGIVADSDPTREYEETRHKAQALLDAVKMASGRRGIR